jgi:tRNA(adenine34) deaminase
VPPPDAKHAASTEDATEPSAPVVITDDERWMGEALREADAAASRGEVPVGCVIVAADGTELARAYNLRETRQDPVAHAEMLAIRDAAAKIGSWRLEDVTVYVTLEPCVMCAGALVHSRVKRVVYGCDDAKAGGTTSLFRIGQDPRLNHRFELTRGVRAEECAGRLRSFFAALRALGKK